MVKISDVEKRMRRFIETSDLKRLGKLEDRLAKLQVALDILKAARTPPNFRDLYGFEAWRVELGDGEEVVH